jgi:hypothetical protein
MFLNVDCFKARIFQNRFVHNEGILSLWVYNVTVIRAGLKFISNFIYSIWYMPHQWQHKRRLLEFEEASTVLRKK